MMVATTLGLALILAESAVGWQPPVADLNPPVVVSGPVVDDPVLGVVVRLQKSPYWRERDEAAITLRHVDWRQHEFVPGALCYTLLNDPDGRVREEAAESLAKLAPCTPVVHEALTRSLATEPRCLTRFWAKRALRKLLARCDGDCSHCGTSATSVVRPGPIVIGPIVMPTVPPIEVFPRQVAPPTDVELGPATGPSVDSGVGPPPTELTPLPPPAEEVNPNRRVMPLPDDIPEPEVPRPMAKRPANSRTRITLLPRFLRPRSER